MGNTVKRKRTPKPNENGLIIENFIRLRKYIDKKVPASAIYMPWWMSHHGREMNGMIVIDKMSCGTEACIYGHCAAGFSRRRYFSTISQIKKFASKFLGDGSDDGRLTNKGMWPDVIYNIYDSGGPSVKKEAVLKRLDRVIERGDLL